MNFGLTSRVWFPGLAAAIGLSLLGALIGNYPVLVATLSVAFLAGPHNYMEARYLLSRLPGRAGKLRPYFVWSAYGVALLGVFSLLLPFFGSGLSLRCWNAALIAWVAGLAVLRRREHPRRAWPWVEPLGLFVCGLMWAQPQAFTLFLVLGHPLLSLVILGRELHAFRRPERRYYPQLLAAVPVGLMVLLVWLFSGGMTGPSEIRSFFLASPGSPLFLAIHTYLELIHYIVWIGLLPLLAQLTQRGNLKVYPILKKSAGRLRAARLFLVLGAVLACLLWWGFTQDFELTRDLYFRVAIFHVLVEFPFLMRLL